MKNAERISLIISIAVLRIFQRTTLPSALPCLTVYFRRHLLHVPSEQQLVTTQSEAVAKLVAVCPGLRHLSLLGLHKLIDNYFALAQKDGPAIESYASRLSQLRSSIERGLSRLVSTGSLAHVSLSNLNDTSLVHLTNEVATRRTLRLTRQNQMEGLTTLFPDRCPYLCDLMLDDVNVSTSSLPPLLKLQIFCISFILQTGLDRVRRVLTRILLAGANHALTHIWLTNTLTTEMAPEMLIASSLKEIDTNRRWMT